MGKRSISQEAANTSKTKAVENKKLQLNSLIKVLRPKVYITDTSSFKRLVQELTGNTNTSDDLPHTNHSPEIPQNSPVFDGHGSPDQQTGEESSVDSLLGFDHVIDDRDQGMVRMGDIYSDVGLFLEDDHQLEQQREWVFEADDEQYCYPSYCGGYSEQEVSLFEFNEFSAGII